MDVGIARFEPSDHIREPLSAGCQVVEAQRGNSIVSEANNVAANLRSIRFNCLLDDRPLERIAHMTWESSRCMMRVWKLRDELLVCSM